MMGHVYDGEVSLFLRQDVVFMSWSLFPIPSECVLAARYDVLYGSSTNLNVCARVWGIGYRTPQARSRRKQLVYLHRGIRAEW